MISDQTKFKSGIVAEFTIPDREVGRVVILCDGAPTVPSKRRLIKFFVKRGFSVFHIRYRGTWESEGSFLQTSPHQDIVDVLDELPRGFRGVWSSEGYKIDPKEVIVVCSSFGGPAGFLVSSDPRIKKVVAVSPVVDWREQNDSVESIEEFRGQIEFGYPGAYRAKEDGWKNLEGGKFYNPTLQESSISGKKIFIIQTEDDDTVSVGPVKAFAKRIGAEILVLEKGGHMGASSIMRWRIWWKVRKFLKS